MKHIRTIVLLAAVGQVGYGVDARADSKQGGVMTHVPQEQSQQDAQQTKPMTATHFDPNMATPESIKDVPQIDPGKVPSPGRHTDAPQAPAGPDAAGFQTEDHLLDDIHRRDGMPGDPARYERVVKEVFEDAGGIRDLPGMEGSEVDPMDMLGGGDDDALGKFGDAAGRGPGGGSDAIENAVPMPESTTPRQTPENAGPGPGRAPVGPPGPRGAMAGAASQDGGRVVYRGSDGSYTTRHDVQNQNLLGARTTTFHRYDSDGTYRGSSQHTTHRDGSTSEMHSQVDPDGRTHIQRTHTDADGEQREVIDTVYNPDGSVRSERVRVNDEDVAGMPREDADPDGAWARWHAERFGNRPDTGMKNPNRVNPGDPDYDGAAIPAGGIDLGDDIVVNPDPTRAAQESRQVSGERAAHWREQLLEGEGPGGRPPDPEL